MKKIGFKVISILLTTCIILGGVPINKVNASNTIPLETYVNKEEGYILTRSFDGESVKVLVKALDGSIRHKLVKENEGIYLDGKLIVEDVINPIKNMTSEYLNMINTASSSWGNWNYTNFEPIQTGGFGTALLAASIAVLVPYLPISKIYQVAVGLVAAGAGTTAGMFDEVQITMRIRYREDNNYLYYERETSFYGDGKHVLGPIKDSGRESLRY